MTESMLLSVLMVICGQEKGVEHLNKEKVLECAYPYINCAIVNDGQILTLPEFQKKCLKVK